MTFACMHASRLSVCGVAHYPAQLPHVTAVPRSLLQCRSRLRQGVRVAAEKRDSTVFGDLLDEDEQIKNIPPPGEQDFWEGEKWEWLGKLSFVLVPALVVVAVLVGAFAAKTYDSGATSYLAPPSPEDATVKLIPGNSE